MNLIYGNIVDKGEAAKIIKKLDYYILKSKAELPLKTELLISACDRLSECLGEGELEILKNMGIPEGKAKQELEILKLMLSKEFLQKRLETELGRRDIFEYSNEYIPYGYGKRVQQRLFPLGTLFHISAGNFELLAAFSIIEGLLCGNINIVKLASSDDGLSLMLLKKLTDIEPVLKDFIFVFDIPSDDTESMQRISEISDALVVWGGDEAIKAARNLTKPDTRIIEWGHKISFAYVSYKKSLDEISDEALHSLTYNICNTKQLLCNSCQGIFLNTDKFEELQGFCKRFLPILEESAKNAAQKTDTHTLAAKSLEIYTEMLESMLDKSKLVFRGNGVNVIAYRDRRLTSSYMFGNPWVKALPAQDILETLLPYKNYLQTLALICPNEERNKFEDLFSKTGIVRICNAEDMSVNYCGLPHDGEFSLRRYLKIMTYER